MASRGLADAKWLPAAHRDFPTWTSPLILPTLTIWDRWNVNGDLAPAPLQDLPWVTLVRTCVFLRWGIDGSTTCAKLASTGKLLLLETEMLIWAASMEMPATIRLHL